MSRTVRRKQGLGWCHGPKTVKDELRELTWDKVNFCLEIIHHDPHSKEGKRRIAKFHSDASYLYNKCGPMHFLRYYYQRPYRRKAKVEIQKSLLNDEIELMIPDKPKLGWWD